MTMHRTRGEVPFPYFGGDEYLYLRFRTGDLVQLRQKYAENYREVVMIGLEKLDPIVLLDCLKYGLKYRSADGEEKIKRLLSAQEEDLPFSLDEVQMAIANALCLAWQGKSYEDLIRERAEQIGRQFDSLDGEGPADPPETSSSASTASAPGPDSLQTL